MTAHTLPEPYKKVRPGRAWACCPPAAARVHIVEDEDYPIDVSVYTADQMREYGKAERERALEEAAQVGESFDSCDPKYIASAIRALKEKS